jgi:hypothetical protein
MAIPAQSYQRQLVDEDAVPFGASNPMPIEQAAVTSATNIAHGITALSTTAAQLRPANTTRHRIQIKNLDASINVAIGFDATVTMANGFRLLAQPAAVTPSPPIEIRTQSALWMISASGTPSVSWLEEYDT